MMLRRRYLVAAIAVMLLALAAWVLWPTERRGINQISIQFAGYETNLGSRRVVLMITNGSSFAIARPDHCLMSGKTPTGQLMGRATQTYPRQAPQFANPNNRWALPKIPIIRPGGTFKLTVP